MNTIKPKKPHSSKSPKYLLLVGVSLSGKSATLKRLADNFLVKKGFAIKHGSRKRRDFIALFKNEKGIRVVVCTPADRPKNVDELKKFIKACPHIDIIISAIRPDWHSAAKHFWKIMGIGPSDANVVQVPITRITPTRYLNRMTEWHQKRMDALLEHILSNAPFGL